MSKKSILIINGPNLNMLGLRDPEIYGSTTYSGLCRIIREYVVKKGFKPKFFQSNHEGKIIDIIQAGGYNGIIINPGALTHYSYAVRDALEIVSAPKIEVHISDISAREDFRRKSVITEVCDRIITGQGIDGYLRAVDAVIAFGEVCY